MKSLESSPDRKSFWNLESPITYHCDRSYDDETLSLVSSISTISPSRNIMADYESLRDFSVEDDTPIIK